MAKEPYMKAVATMDNSDLQKKSRESMAALRDFEKTGTDAVSKLGEAFGVNTGKIEQMLSSLRGLGEKMSESGNAGTAAFGKLLTSINGVSAGLAGIGIAGVVAVFKLLNDEAAAFKNTMEGSHIDVMTTAYVETYRQALHDFNAETGKNVAEAQAAWTKAWQSFVANLMFEILNMDLKTAIVGPLGSLLLGGDNTEVYDEANQKATEAGRLAERMLKIQQEMSAKAVEWARMERDIAEYKRIAYDKTVSLTEQQNALAKATELIKERYKEEAKYKKQLADLQVQYNGLVSSAFKDEDKANKLRIDSENVVARLSNAVRELSDRQASVTAAAQKEAEARRQALALAQQQLLASVTTEDERQQMSDFSSSIPAAKLEMNFPKLEVPVAPVLDTTAVTDISAQLESALTTSFENIGVSLGNLIGDLATGGDAWGNFTDMAISSFGDMAVTVGKMAVSTGMATLGIKAALESLNGYVAIAAGVALIALGSAVKTGLSNVASGNYNASSNVASATGSYGAGSINTGFESREININVTGTLRADGNQLVTVIENENKRRTVTT